MKKSKILFVLEGQRTEFNLVESLSKFFVNEHTLIKCAYCAEIYQLFKKLKQDEDLDTFSLLKNIPENKKLLAEFTREDFAEVYLFFDYDGHSSLADDASLKELFQLFNEETEHGRLYLSYPMVECLKHCSEKIDFKNLCVEAKKNVRYKEIVGREGAEDYKHFSRYTLKTWQTLITIHLKKMNYLMCANYDWPLEHFSQKNIFQKQCVEYIEKKGTVAVLSAFPVFMFDYYGIETMKEKIAIK